MNFYSKQTNFTNDFDFDYTFNYQLNKIKSLPVFACLGMVQSMFVNVSCCLCMFMLGLFSGLLAEYIRKFPIVVMIFIWLHISH